MLRFLHPTEAGPSIRPADLVQFINRMRAVREGEERLVLLLQAEFDPGPLDGPADPTPSHLDPRESVHAFARRIGYSAAHVVRLVGLGLPRDKDLRIPIAAALAWVERYQRVQIHFITHQRQEADDGLP